MKVLLLGEFSSLHKYLKEGLLELGGIEVVLASDSDGWKNIGGADVLFPEKRAQKNLIQSMKTYQVFLKLYKGFKNFDVVQYVNPNLFPMLLSFGINKYILERNVCLSLVAAGNDYRLVRSYLDDFFEYYSLTYDEASLIQYDCHSVRGKMHIRNDLYLEKNVDIIIPSAYEYQIGYRDNKKVYDVIPFPVNIDQIKYGENTVKDKVVFFHGLNRAGPKGTKFIKAAMEKLKQVYPDQVEIIIDGHMPFERYMEVLSRTNVVIDQCCGYGYGINACISMAQGKIVLSGCRDEHLKSLGISSAPVFPVKPDVDVIFEKMSYIVEHRQEIPKWGYESRKYVENIHDYRINAQKYVDAWKSTGKI